MGMTMTQKILAAHAGLDNVKAGQLIRAKLDMVLGNDVTTPVAIKEFKAAGFEKVFDKKVTDEEFNQLTNDERMAMDEADATEEMQPLDYIFSRDILNEGLQHK